MSTDATRTSLYPIEELILLRWSPRAMSGEPIGREDLFTLFEAARWAPSAMNGQPWRFIYALRETPAWETLFDLLVEGNRVWCVRAAALVCILSRNEYEHNGKPHRTHSYDCGAAWENLALQGTAQGLVVHGMAGFDYDKARDVLHVPHYFTVEAMAAVGRPGAIADLPPTLQEREQPSQRRPLQELVFEGVFPTSTAD